MKIRKEGFWGLSAVLLASLLFLFSCSPISQYSVDMRYTPAFAPDPVAAKDVAIKLAGFNDLRKTEDPLVIGRVERFDGARVRVFPKYKTAADAVTEGVRAYLVKSGASVPPETEKWDLRESTIKKADRGIMIGGSIDELELICREEIPVRKYDARIKLTFVVADLRQGRIIYRTSAESSSNMDFLLFSEEKMQEQANSILAGAIERIFFSSDIRGKINSAWRDQLNPQAAKPEKKLPSGEEPFVNPEEEGPIIKKSPIESKDIN
ncbi:MAG: hypothetical protein ABFD62_02255 [Syntrophaceae bacterium]